MSWIKKKTPFERKSFGFYTVINSVYVQTLPTEQVPSALTDSFSWGHDPFTHACKARPLTVVGWTSLSVIVIVIVIVRKSVCHISNLCRMPCFDSPRNRPHLALTPIAVPMAFCAARGLVLTRLLSQSCGSPRGFGSQNIVCSIKWFLRVCLDSQQDVDEAFVKSNESSKIPLGLMQSQRQRPQPFASPATAGGSHTASSRHLEFVVVSYYEAFLISMCC